MYDDRPAPRDFSPEGSTDERDEIIEGDPAYDPAKQAPIAEEGTVDEMVDVENPEEVAYDLEDLEEEED